MGGDEGDGNLGFRVGWRAVRLRLLDPKRTLTELTYPGTIVRESDGVFSYEVDSTLAGQYWQRWIGYGAAAGVQEAPLLVLASHFPADP